MKTKNLLVIGILLTASLCANATTMDFYTDGTIIDGNDFDTVNVWNTATVDMTGGCAFYCNLYDSSIFNTYGGDTSILSTHQTSQAWLYADDATGAYIYDQSVVHMFNGGFSTSLFLYDSGQLHIYGYSLSFTYSDEINGFWPDGEYFYINLRNPGEFNPDEQVFLHEIPEPSTLSLLGLLALFIRKRGDFSSLRN